MNRDEFMAEIAGLLSDLPDNERMEAIRYYNDYLDEAGEENEEKAIRELGEPREIAANIKADLLEHEFTEEKSTFPDQGSVVKVEKRTGHWVLIVVLLVLASPILLGLGGGLLGLVLGLFGAFVGIFFACLASGASLLIGGIALIVKGIWNLFHMPAIGIAGLGGGLLCVAVGILLLLLFGWFLFRMVPWIWRWCKRMISNRRK